MSAAALARSPLFEGLTDAELEVVAERMRPRQFANLIQIAYVNGDRNIRRITIIQEMLQSGLRRDSSNHVSKP